MKHLEDELHKPEAGPPESYKKEPVPPPEKYIPTKYRETRDNSHISAPMTSFGTQTPLQIIATAIKRLVWDDNEHLAQLVERHHKDNDTNMAKAIQMAADDLLKETDER